ncbi:MAG: type II toxin-antitoxin system VapC family toxin [Chloroflexi bacterium]|nr:type II toxin-antitoxin system VapC family toxin [Chloroflexota bacterium]
MKTAVDSNVLFDLLAGDTAASVAAEQALAAATGSGVTVICPVVYTELATGFRDQPDLGRFLRDLSIQLEAFSEDALQRAARAWGAYVRRRGRQIQCPRCGQRFDLHCPACQSVVVWRQHLITDFLVGGHATAQADLLLTRDPGYYRTYFPELRLSIPSN